MIRKLSLALCICLLVQTFAQTSHVKSQGCFVGLFRGNIQRTGVYPDDCAPEMERLSLLWSHEFENASNAEETAPILMGDNLYLALDDGNLYSVDSQNGKENWKKPHTFDYGYFKIAGENGKIIVNGNILKCFDAKTGNELWKSDEDGISNYSQPLIVDGKVLIARRDSLNCFELATGKQLWSYQAASDVSRSAACQNGRVFFTTDDGLVYCLDLKKGKLIWKATNNGQTYVNFCPSVEGDFVYTTLIANEISKLYFFGVSDGRLAVSKSFSKSSPRSPTTANGKIYLSERNGKLWCLDKESKKDEWSIELPEPTFIAPTYSRGRLYTVSNGALYVLSAKDGKELWRYNLGTEVRAEVVVGNGKVFVFGYSGKLFCFADQKEVDFSAEYMHLGFLSDTPSENVLEISNNSSKEIEFKLATDQKIFLSKSVVSVASNSFEKIIISPNLELSSKGMNKAKIEINWDGGSKTIDLEYFVGTADGYSYSCDLQGDGSSFRSVTASQAPKKSVLKKLWEDSQKEGVAQTYYNGLIFTIDSPDMNILEASTGKRLFKMKVATGFTRGFQFEGNNVYCITNSGPICIDLNTMAIKWKYTVDQGGGSAPIIGLGGGKVFMQVASDRSLKILDASTGKLIRSVPVLKKDDDYGNFDSDYRIAYWNGFVYLTGKELCCVDVEKGAIAWKTDGWAYIPIIIGDSLYYYTRKPNSNDITETTCADPKTGKQIWKSSLYLTCLVGDKGYCLAKNSITCVGLDNGKELWKKDGISTEIYNSKIYRIGENLLVRVVGGYELRSATDGNLLSKISTRSEFRCAGNGKLYFTFLYGDHSQIKNECYEEVTALLCNPKSLDFSSGDNELKLVITNYTDSNQQISFDLMGAPVTITPTTASVEVDGNAEFRITCDRARFAKGENIFAIKAKWSGGEESISIFNYVDTGFPLWPNVDGYENCQTPNSSNLDMQKLSLLWEKDKTKKDITDSRPWDIRGNIYAVSADGKIFVFEKQSAESKSSGIFCLDVNDGKLLWAQQNYKPITLAYLSGKLYMVSNGDLYCLSASSGHELWKKEIFAGIKLTSFDGLLFDNLGCINPRNGEYIWKFDFEFLEYPQHNFAFGDGKVFAFQNSMAMAFEARTGKVLWEKKHDFNVGSVAYTTGVLFVTDVNTREGDYYSYGDEQIIAYGIGKWNKLWTKKNSLSYMWGANGYLFAYTNYPCGDILTYTPNSNSNYYERGCGGKMDVYDAATGEIKTSNSFSKSSNPVVARNKYYYALNDVVYGQNISIQTDRWRKWAGSYITRMICVGNKLLALCSNGSIKCYSSSEGLLFGNEYIDFGEVAPNSKKTFELSIQNLSPEKQDLTTTCSMNYTKIESTTMTFQPGETKNLKFTIDLSEGITKPNTVVRGSAEFSWKGMKRTMHCRAYCQNETKFANCIEAVRSNANNPLNIYPSGCAPKGKLRKYAEFTDAYATKGKIVTYGNGKLEHYAIGTWQKTFSTGLGLKLEQNSKKVIPDHQGGFYYYLQNKLTKYDENTGRELWTVNLNDDAQQSINMLYFTDKFAIVATEWDLYCLDRVTGKKVWKKSEAKKTDYTEDNPPPSDNDSYRERIIHSITIKNSYIYMASTPIKGDIKYRVSVIQLQTGTTIGKIESPNDYYHASQEIRPDSVRKMEGFQIDKMTIYEGKIFLQASSHVMYFSSDYFYCIEISSGKTLYQINDWFDMQTITAGKLKGERFFYDIETGERIAEEKNLASYMFSSGDTYYGWIRNIEGFNNNKYPFINADITSGKITSSFYTFNNLNSTWNDFYNFRSLRNFAIDGYIFCGNEKLLCIGGGAASTLEFKIGSSKYKADGVEYDMGTAPQVIGGTTYIPAKFVVEPLGGDTSWNSQDKSISVILNGITIHMNIGKNKASIDGKSVQIDPKNPKVAPVIVGGRTMVPMRFLAENLGCKLDFDSNTKKITISMGR